MTPDSRLQSGFGYLDVDEDDSSDMAIVEWGVRYDTVIPGLPILGDSNVFVGYRGAHFDKDTLSGDDAEVVDYLIIWSVSLTALVRHWICPTSTIGWMQAKHSDSSALPANR